MSTRSKSNPPPRAVRVSIDTVVVDDLRAADKAALATDIQTHLQRLLRARGPGSQGIGRRSLGSLDGSRFVPPPASSPATTAQRVAERIHGSLNR